MKKFLFLILCVCMAVTSYAAASNVYQFEYEDQDITIIFDENTLLSDHERQFIADLMVYGDSDTDNISAYSWCWLTGHDITSDTVTTIQHKVSSSSPRCYMTVYQVDTCSKCDYVETTALSSVYISCCPED